MKTLFFVGPTKTGTTAIWHALNSFSVPLPLHNKESFYFDMHYSQCKKTYMSEVCGENRDVIVEVSPTYFCSHDVPYRIYDMFPSAQIVITLREPIARTISCYRHSLRYRSLDIMQALAEDEQVAASKYTRHCARWLSVFGSNNVVVARQDDTGAFPDAMFSTLACITGIGVLGTVKMDKSRHNSAVVARSKYAARTINKLNHYLRHRGASRVVEMAKQIGLRKLIYKHGVSNDFGGIHEEQLCSVREYLSDEVQFYNMLGDPLTRGHDLHKLVAAYTNVYSECNSLY